MAKREKNFILKFDAPTENGSYHVAIAQHPQKNKFPHLYSVYIWKWNGLKEDWVKDYYYDREQQCFFSPYKMRYIELTGESKEALYIRDKLRSFFAQQPETSTPKTTPAATEQPEQQEQPAPSRDILEAHCKAAYDCTNTEDMHSLLDTLSAEILSGMCKLVNATNSSGLTKAECIDAFISAAMEHKAMKAARESQASASTPVPVEVKPAVIQEIKPEIITNTQPEITHFVIDQFCHTWCMTPTKRKYIIKIINIDGDNITIRDNYGNEKTAKISVVSLGYTNINGIEQELKAEFLTYSTRGSTNQEIDVNTTADKHATQEDFDAPAPDDERIIKFVKGTTYYENDRAYMVIVRNGDFVTFGDILTGDKIRRKVDHISHSYQTPVEICSLYSPKSNILRNTILATNTTPPASNLYPQHTAVLEAELTTPASTPETAPVKINPEVKPDYDATFDKCAYTPDYQPNRAVLDDEPQPHRLIIKRRSAPAGRKLPTPKSRRQVYDFSKCADADTLHKALNAGSIDVVKAIAESYREFQPRTDGNPMTKKEYVTAIVKLYFPDYQPKAKPTKETPQVNYPFVPGKIYVKKLCDNRHEIELVKVIRRKGDYITVQEVSYPELVPMFKTQRVKVQHDRFLTQEGFMLDSHDTTDLTDIPQDCVYSHSDYIYNPDYYQPKTSQPEHKPETPAPVQEVKPETSAPSEPEHQQEIITRRQRKAKAEARKNTPKPATRKPRHAKTTDTSRQILIPFDDEERPDPASEPAKLKAKRRPKMPRVKTDYSRQILIDFGEDIPDSKINQRQAA